ncbi:MAG: methyltransferase domain-containing protein [Desulfopila sp.]|jgi:SAM-dependent methyltransferase|nr:methyltransferase domain-containing protein [Desulfopila sp.]
MSNQGTCGPQETLHQIVSLYLSSRPSFYAFIRPQEAFLLRQNISLLQRPILDFGCGDGFFTNVLHAGQWVDAGLDIDEEKIGRAHAVKSYKKLLCFDGERIPFASESFATIFSNSVLEHISHLEITLGEIYRVLRPEGIFITTVMSDKWEQSLPLGKILGKRYVHWLRKRQRHKNLFSYQKWQDTFNDHGFTSGAVIGYVNEKTSQYLEVCHYCSLLSLLSYKLSGVWVPFPHWHKPLKLAKKITSIIQDDINTPIPDSSALFFILKKAP